MVKVDRQAYRSLRVHAGFRSDSAVARQVGITRQRLSQILNSDDASGVPLGIMWRLAKVLGCSHIDDILETDLEWD